MDRSRFVFLLSFAALAMAARPAFAQSTPPPVDTCAAMRAAWTRDAPAAKTIALAECEAKSDRPRDVAELLSPLVRTSAGTDDERLRAQTLFDAARARVGAVGLEVDVQEAHVSIDGLAVGQAPFVDPVFLAPGHHTFTAQTPGRAPARREIDVRAGESTALVLRVIPLRADAIGYDAPTDPIAAATEPRTRSTPLILGGASVAFVALTTALALNLAANAQANIARRAQASIHDAGGSASACTGPTAPYARDCSTLHDALGSRDTYANASIAGYVVAGAAAVATIAYVVWPAQSAEKRGWVSSVRPAPMVGAGTGGLQLTGKF